MSLFNSALFPPAPRSTDVVNRTHHHVHDLVGPDQTTAKDPAFVARAEVTTQKRSLNETWIILAAIAFVVYVIKRQA